MSDLWIHDLRRSLASSMANTGADVSVVRAALHHTGTLTTLKAYIRTSQQVQLEARQKAQGAWLEAKKRQAEETETAGDEPASKPTRKTTGKKSKEKRKTRKIARVHLRNKVRNQETTRVKHDGLESLIGSELSCRDPLRAS
jgi:Phage integrase family.